MQEVSPVSIPRDGDYLLALNCTVAVGKLGP